MPSYQDAYKNNHANFEISSITYEEDAEQTTDPIEFKYPAPNISVDTAGRFATHKIIGGSTVRQKIGEEPIEVSVEGVCEEPTARALDGLRDAEFGTIYSKRLVGGSLTVHFASVSTSPLEDGGAAALSGDGEFLYSFDLACVEVIVGGSGSDGIDAPPQDAGSTIPSIQ